MKENTYKSLSFDINNRTALYSSNVDINIGTNVKARIFYLTENLGKGPKEPPPPPL